MTAKTLWESSHKLEENSFTIWGSFGEAKGTNIDKSGLKILTLQIVVSEIALMINAGSSCKDLKKINWIRRILGVFN